MKLFFHIRIIKLYIASIRFYKLLFVNLICFSITNHDFLPFTEINMIIFCTASICQLNTEINLLTENDKIQSTNIVLNSIVQHVINNRTSKTQLIIRFVCD